MSIRVLVVDDHPVVRDGIAAILGDAGMVVAATAGTLAAARDALARAAPDVAILDLELPDGSGLDAIGAFRAIAPDLRIVVFSAYAGEDRVRTAMENGANGYILKGTPGDELVRAIGAVAGGGTYLGPEVATQFAGSLLAPRSARITEREREILVLLARGMSNKRIAVALAIGERTVKFHVGEILGRLGAANRAQAVALARERGLL